MKRLWIDLETWGNVDIKNGTDNYARGTEIMLFAYAFDDGPVAVWDLTTDAPMPADLKAALADQSLQIVAHNAAFEQAVLNFHGYGIAPSRWRCTMALALAHGMPGSLDKLCAIFKVDDDKAKLKEGKELVRLFCCPRPKNMKLRRATRQTHPEQWVTFVEYCGNDVSAMREVAKTIPNWNYKGRELELWLLDQKINMRGVPIDTALVDMALLTADRVKQTLADETFDITNGDLKATTQRNALLEMLRDTYGLDIDNLRASTVEKFLKYQGDDVPPVVVELLENRLSASSTSVSKYKSFAKLTGPDGRLRNTLQFCGASRTGRWAGRGVQLQNLPRPTLKQKVIDAGIEAIKADCADLIYDNTMALLQSSVRGCIVASPGKKLVVADLSNIEGRMLAFLAGEQWKLDAFADFDTCKGADGNWYSGDQQRDAALACRPIILARDKKGEPIRKGYDLYALAYAKAFNISPEAVMENKKSGDGSMRQIGKVMELALGYAGGVGAFVTFALAYGIDLDAMAEQAYANIPARILMEAEGMWEWSCRQKRTYGMAQRTFVVCEAFKRLWREAHPATASLWKDLENAFRAAILTPGTEHIVRSLVVEKKGSWVRIRLPSGRYLCYPSARLRNDDIYYQGVNQYTRQWAAIGTYSGKLVENATQAAARDVIAWNMPSIEAAGYEILSTVHDEDITDAPDTPEYNPDHLSALLATNPPWAKGLPLAAAGFEGYRYRKD